jgi:uncharacterized Zn finger protein
MEATLICEGACNPGLKALDKLIVRVGREAALSDCADFARRARYTQHVATVSDVMWRCNDCGHVRRFGGNPSIVFDAMQNVIGREHGGRERRPESA